MFKKVLIANRGEIALRVIWACKELGLKTVAVYSEADANSLHVRFADEAVCIGPPRNIDSYLNIPAIISAAEITGADAIHPGYGFLSESAYFAEICEACNIKFIGPGPQAIRLMGDKSRAKKAMIKAGRAGRARARTGVVEDEEKAVKVARDIGFPVILKASAGGGGRGMRIVREAQDLAQSFRAAQAEAQAAFGVPDVYIEKYVEGPRHIEIQVMADSKGNVVHLGERECSIQRRHQKLIEEAPSLVVTEKLRRRMGRTAVEAAAAVQYVERRHDRVPARQGRQLLLHGDEHPHPGRARRHRARDRPRPREGADPRGGGRAAVVLAEGRRLQRATPSSAASTPRTPSPSCPRPGRSATSSSPAGPGVRVDTFAHEGCEISPYYDSLIAKLMTHGRDRAEAIARMRRSLDVMVVEGIKTNIPLHRRILDDPDFVAGRFDTGFMERFVPAEEGDRGLVSDGRGRARPSRLGRLLPLLLVPVALLPDPAAALPLRSLLLPRLRDGLLPAAALQARELAAGRLPTWNPFVFEGSFLRARALPARPAARALAGAGLRLLAADAAPAARRARRLLARARARRPRAPARSSPAPSTRSPASRCPRSISTSSCRRWRSRRSSPGCCAARRSTAGASVVWAAAAVALALSTYPSSSSRRPSCWAWRSASPRGRPAGALARLAGALALGAGLAGVPIALVAGVLGETARGAGFGGDVALANAVAPGGAAAGAAAAPLRLSRGAGRGLLGRALLQQGAAVLPVPLPRAADARPRGARRSRGSRAAPGWRSLALAGLGALVRARGAGGLAPLVAPAGPERRLPLPEQGAAAAAARGGARRRLRLRPRRRGARRRCAGSRRPLRARRARGARGARARGGAARRARGLERRPAGVLAAARGVVGHDVGVRGPAGDRRGRCRSGSAARACSARAGPRPWSRRSSWPISPARAPASTRRSTRASSSPFPELAALRLADLDGGRVFSYGLDHSPAFRELLAAAGRG